jgi:uncharacterized tellurite resistance protein B-like protein
MKQLIQVRNNISYVKEKTKEGEKKSEEPKYTRVNEIVLLFDVANYTSTNEGEIIRERKVEESRFNVTQKGLEQLIKQLEVYRDADEDELN